MSESNNGENHRPHGSSRSLWGSLVISVVTGAMLLTMGCSGVTGPRAPKAVSVTSFERRTDDAARDSDSFEAKLTLFQELAGWAALKRVAEQVELLQGLPRDSEGQLTDEGERRSQDIIRKLQDSITIDWEVKSRDVDVIAVSVTHSDPEMARQISTGLVENYITQQIIKRLTASRTFLVKQISDSSTRLTELTNKRIEFEVKHAGSMPESPGALQKKIQQVNSDLDTLRRQQMIAKQKVDMILARKGTTNTNPTTQPDEALARSELDIATREIERLKSRLKQLDNMVADFSVFRQEFVEMCTKTREQEAELAQWQKRYANVQTKLSGEVAKHRAQLIKVQTTPQ